ncbi:hypothetical protein A2U01_0031191, partial [Trifolium medium]|nr:hypothetical protein [Trifolium medium]
ARCYKDPATAPAGKVVVAAVVTVVVTAVIVTLCIAVTVSCYRRRRACYVRRPLWLQSRAAMCGAEAAAAASLKEKCSGRRKKGMEEKIK